MALMICPHCSSAMVDAFTNVQIAADGGVTDRAGNGVAPPMMWRAQYQRCPACYEAIIYLEQDRPSRRSYLAYPGGKGRPVPAEVPDPYRRDYVEAFTILPNSAKASAALSRRSLQMILREKALTKKKDLYDQIEEVITSGSVPAYIADDLHAVRNIGNMGAHPMKSTNTGEIVEVEPGEAEWNLDVLDALFDFYFVQPALSAKRKTALDQKLIEIGKQKKP
jgi:hypothetical protein